MKSVKIALKTSATEDVFEAWEGLTPGKLRNFPDVGGEIREFAETFRTPGIINWGFMGTSFGQQQQQQNDITISGNTFTTGGGALSPFGSQLLGAGGNLGGSGGAGSMIPLHAPTEPTAW